MIVRLHAPAKLNLFLHVNGKRDDGYHLLDSLVVFPQGIEDRITIEPAPHFSLSVTGEFQKDLSYNDLSSAPTSGNLVVQAAYAYAKMANVPMHFKITLDKNIPLGTGLGGGSTDAATTIRGLEQFHRIPLEHSARDALLLKLGADVPVCYVAKASRFQGIGEIISPVPVLPSLHILLVWPKKASFTKNIFAKFSGSYKDPVVIPKSFDNLEVFIAFLKLHTNDLTDAAEQHCPDIKTARDIMAAQTDCLLSRMTGSGACVFGLFESASSVQTAKAAIAAAHHGWCVRIGEI